MDADWMDLLDEKNKEIERLRKANKVQACTIRSLQYSKSKTEHEAHIAVKTLDSEKEANAILTNEIERLQKQIRYQEHRDGRVGTHDPICYGYGPSHYECALRKIDMLRELLNADNQTLRLHLGELTLKEVRIVKAAFQWVLIRAELKEG